MIDFDSLRDLPIEERAVELRRSHVCNCCQAVVAVLTEDSRLIEAAAPFGGGMGNTQGPCGTLIGAYLAAGARTGGKGTARYTRQMWEKFRDQSGAIVCRDLKGLDTGVVLCSCEQCVRNGVMVFRDVMGE